MKKIFAIALALVMVLSMASAFAFEWTLDCGVNGFNWDCSTTSTNCGKGAIEVVPYVKANAACDSWEYVVSDCASAIKSEKVYFAIKMTVDADPSESWWYKASAEVETDGLDVTVTLPGGTGLSGLRNDIVSGDYADKYDEDEEQVFYLLKDGSAWINEEDDAFELKNVVIPAKVTDADDAEVCATLVSEHDGYGTFTWGDYVVEVGANSIVFTDDDDNRNVVTISIVDEKVKTVNYTGDIAFYNEVVAEFNLNACTLGTCINEDSVQANFGWDFEQEDCFNWSTKGASVVDVDCVVAIPKTGDAGLLWWLF